MKAMFFFSVKHKNGPFCQSYYQKSSLHFTFKVEVSIIINYHKLMMLKSKAKVLFNIALSLKHQLIINKYCFEGSKVGNQ